MILINLLMFSSTSAKASAFYTNDSGVDMTQSQYEKVIATYGEEYVKIISQYNFDNFIAGKMKLVSSETAYFIVKSKNINGTVVSIDKQVTKDEYNNFVPNTYSARNTDSNKEYETNAKILNMLINAMEDNGQLYAQIELHCFWKTMPIVRSYDISAVRWSTSNTMKYNVLYVTGEQDYKINGTRGKVEYSDNGTNSKRFSNAGGISMNILDDATSDLHTAIYVTGKLTGSGKLTAYGTYQHAVRYITLDESKSYTISSSGLGGVLKHSYASSFDAMQGLMVSYNR